MKEKTLKGEQIVFKTVASKKESESQSLGGGVPENGETR